MKKYIDLRSWNVSSRRVALPDGSFCRIWKDGKWVDKADYIVIDLEED